MIIGNPFIIAIESGITRAYDRLSERALGFFVIYVGGHRFGVYESDATMMGCSFDAVQRRVSERGTHTSAFATGADAEKIADAFRHVCCAEEQGENYFGISPAEFRELFYRGSGNLMWAPDGDEAFDDGSFVLQFDVDDQVRLIAFKSCEGYGYDPVTLRMSGYRQMSFIEFFSSGMRLLTANGRPCRKPTTPSKHQASLRTARSYCSR